ncbi:MAG TPA: T9SS type A sorting domain-containing protein, partial [Bacteroidetes bacterium]|nr:T9SS type A sorting domain-containing protein [Bacteroidota bacterium]
IKYGNVQVDNGSTLTIRGNVAFVSGAGLFIEPNAKVYVDGGRLTSLCGSTWQGIDVWGDKYSDQFPDQNGNRTQGFIELMNGGTISNALIGIETTKYDNASALTNYSGGIVIIKDGMIENCEQGVVFYPYKNYHPYAYTHEANLSYFSQTRFYNDKNFPPVNQLKMDGVDGIEIKGCSFENDATPSDYSMPVGIFSISSTFYAGNYVPLPWEGDPVRTTFKNFDKAIFAVNNSAYGNIKIDSVYFEDNLRGIYLSAVDYPVIIQNEFNVRKRFSFFPENLGDDAMIGLYINDPSDGFVVEENEFYTGLHSGKLETTQCAGIHLTNTGGYPNEIYNNKLHDLTVGITAAGSNQDGNSAGLCIKCNDFTRCFNDVYITNEGGTTNLGIATDQGVPVPVPPEGELGDPTQAAGNTFSETDVQNPYNFNYGNFNGCNPVIYTYHGNYDAGRYKLRPEPVFPRPPSQQIDLNKDDNVWYNSKSEACPSNYNGGGIDLMASNSTYSSELVSVNAYEDTLSIFVDGGDTESLTWDVNMSTPPEAVEVRQALLNDSPYLSDTVMKAAIAKEDVLPNAMVRDVLVANPQSAKSTEVLQFLDNRSDTMPGYMMDQVMQGQNIVGAKELLEQNLAGHKTKKGKALKKLMHYYLADTTDFEASNDSIISLLATDNELQSRYKLSLRYLGLKDSAGAYSTFYGIPSEFDLNNEQENEYDLYEDLLDLRWQMIADTATPDSLTIAALFNIEAYYNTAPGVHARNILIGLGELEYDEPVYFPEFNKATPIWRRSFKHNMGASTLKVFPNPAGSYFIAEYKLYETLGTNMLVLTDLNGHNILVINIQKKQNQIVILTSGIKPGVYILQLINGSKVQESVKIAILK